MNKSILKFCLWVVMELAGSWAIWSSFTTIKFMIEVAQGQKAAFSLNGSPAVGAFIILPGIATLIWTIWSATFASNVK